MGVDERAESGRNRSGHDHLGRGWVDESGHSSMIPNAEGELLTPSVVLFADQEVVVGKEARSAVTVQPDGVAQWVKRDMGAPFYSHPIHGQRLPPEVIQACILRKLEGSTAAPRWGSIRVVITVPAYFDEPRRKATADAGEMAGLGCWTSSTSRLPPRWPSARCWAI